MDAKYQRQGDALVSEATGEDYRARRRKAINEKKERDRLENRVAELEAAVDDLLARVRALEYGAGG